MAALSVLVTKTRRLLDERDDTNTHFEDDELTDNINDAVMFLATEMEWPIQTSTATSIVGQALYGGPDDFVSLTEAYYDGTPLSILERDDLKEINQEWQSADNATPKILYKADNKVFGLYPPPDTANLEIQIQYISLPATLTQDADIPDIHSAFQLCLPYYAASVCEAGMGNQKSADFLMGRYKFHKDALKSKVQRFSDDLYRFRWPQHR